MKSRRRPRQNRNVARRSAEPARKSSSAQAGVDKENSRKPRLQHARKSLPAPRVHTRTFFLSAGIPTHRPQNDPCEVQIPDSLTASTIRDRRPRQPRELTSKALDVHALRLHQRRQSRPITLDPPNGSRPAQSRIPRSPSRHKIKLLCACPISPPTPRILRTLDSRRPNISILHPQRPRHLGWQPALRYNPASAAPPASLDLALYIRCSPPPLRTYVPTSPTSPTSPRRRPSASAIPIRIPQ